jgi:toxin ParE1/3/4
MNRYKLSKLAERDLEDIWLYIAKNNQIAADNQIAKILDCLPMLAQFPDIGQIKHDLRNRLRSFPVKPYIVFYIKVDNGIEVVRVLHQSRDIDHQFFE